MSTLTATSTLRPSRSVEPRSLVTSLAAVIAHDDAERRRLAHLTAREREILGLVAEGLSNEGIAHHLWLTEKTVETHVRSIFGKLELRHRDGNNRRVVAAVLYVRAIRYTTG